MTPARQLGVHGPRKVVKRAPRESASLMLDGAGAREEIEKIAATPLRGRRMSQKSDFFDARQNKPCTPNDSFGRFFND